MSRTTLYRWERRPELRSRRPKRVCGRTWAWPARLVEAGAALRDDNPVWGKRKLGPLLRQAGHAVSDAIVGRILAYLVRRGRVLPVPASWSGAGVSCRCRLSSTPRARRRRAGAVG